MQNSLKIVKLPPQLMHIPISWAKAEGWNPGLEDALSFYAADSNGFLLAYYDDTPVACISTVDYAGLFAFLGFYIVEPRFRGQGFGRQIWDYALQHTKCPVIGLDGVLAQQDFYRRSGFELAHRNIRYQGISESNPDAESVAICPRDMHYERLCNYDAKHFGLPRSRFLQAWLLQKNARARIILQDSRILAFGVIRECFEGYKIGPLFAEHYAAAELMFKALLNTVPAGTKFWLDIPQPNQGALKLVEAHAMQPVFETARMYRGKALNLPLKQIYGITSFELG